MAKEKKFYVSWDERHSIVVSAKNEEEAKEIVFNGEFNPKKAQGEYIGNEEAFEVGKERSVRNKLKIMF